MTGPCMPVGSLTEDEVQGALVAAIAAPSLHNSQPWRFRCTPSAIELHADLSRELPATDPEHREMMLACGAALLNLRLAIRMLNVATDVRLLPDPRHPDLLAEIRPEGFARATENDRLLASAITRRHTNRRPFLDDPVPEPLRGRMRDAARNEQAWMAIVPPEQQAGLRALLTGAHRLQHANPAFVAEWQRWTGRVAGEKDGVPAGSAGLRPQQQDRWMMRSFDTEPGPPRRQGKDFESDPLIAVIGSFHDLPLAQLQAGQAMQRVLLTATAAGLSSSFLSQVVEVPAARTGLRDLIGGGVWPQAVLRLGYGVPAAATARRSLADVVDVGEALTT